MGLRQGNRQLIVYGMFCILLVITIIMLWQTVDKMRYCEEALDYIEANGGLEMCEGCVICDYLKEADVIVDVPTIR